MSIYCTYLTTYRGNKLPPFYIGFSTIEKVHKGYHGTVKSKEYQPIWNQELKEYPELFKTNILTIHDTKEEATIREVKFQKQLGVIKNPLYINLVVGRHSDRTGSTLTKEHKEKIRNKMNERVRSGLHHLSGGKVVWKQIAEGKHPTQKIIVCPICGQECHGGFTNHLQKHKSF